MVNVFANVAAKLGFIPDLVMPKTEKMVLNASWLNTQVNAQHYKVQIKDMISALPYNSVLLLKRDPSGHAWLRPAKKYIVQHYILIFYLK